jgi:hypothetical protein
MSKREKQYYVVVNGRSPGIYSKWFGEGGAADQVANFPEALYKGFYTREEAIEWLGEGGRPPYRHFHRMLKPSGLALLCLGEDDLEDDIDEDYLGARMYWSHYDAETSLKMIKECGFDAIWSKVVADNASPGAAHLFVLAQKGRA